MSLSEEDFTMINIKIYLTCQAYFMISVLLTKVGYSRYLPSVDILVSGNVSGIPSRLNNLTKDKFFPRLCNSLTESTYINKTIY